MPTNLKSAVWCLNCIFSHPEVLAGPDLTPLTVTAQPKTHHRCFKDDTLSSLGPAGEEVSGEGGDEAGEGGLVAEEKIP